MCYLFLQQCAIWHTIYDFILEKYIQKPFWFVLCSDKNLIESNDSAVQIIYRKSEQGFHIFMQKYHRYYWITT